MLPPRPPRPRYATRKELVEEAKAVLSSEPLVTSIGYISVGSRATMEEVQEVGEAGAVMSVALRLGSVRLIDNIILPPLGESRAATPRP